ncbi:Tetratricopeptide repeat family protein [Giardia duodenalis]|uniref:Tetratricopeptide repeat family protein n=1 Tax=Giardia intestinalis TaxID=5741 RepID=V6TKJ9_GIAIN|nr:Tetratricopeptide repeat family protein [Giardia intestinalis]
MEEIECSLMDMENALSAFQKHISAYKSNPTAASAKASLASADTALSKAKGFQTQVDSLLKGVTGLEARRAQQQFKLLQTKIANASQELEQAKRRADAKKVSSKASTVDDLLTIAAQKKQENVNLLEDANRNCDEAGTIGNAIVEDLGRQNEQLRGISSRATKIQANARGGAEITNRMIKCERIIKIVLWSASVLFLGLSALGFYVYHHNVPHNNPEPAPEPPEIRY